MLSQLVYVSNRQKSCTQQEIDDILDACKRNNPAMEVTGVLLYSDNKFIQLVEGDTQKILRLYDTIKKDERHENCVMISCTPTEEKTFPSWHMGSKEFKSNKLSFETNISQEDEDFFNDILLGKEQNGEQVVKILKKFFN